MKFPWSKQNRNQASEDATNALLREVMEARQSMLSPKDALAEMIRIGNRDVGLENRPQPTASRPLATYEGPVAAPEPGTEARAAADAPEELPAEALADDSLSGLTMEELVSRLGDSGSAQKAS